MATTLVELLTQSLVPVVVLRPETIKLESLSVAMVTSLVEFGVKVEAPLALNASPVLTVNPLLKVAVPPVAPIAIVVAAPPILSVVTLLLKREAVFVVDVISALVGPLTAKSPPAVTFPVKVDVRSIVKFPLA